MPKFQLIAAGVLCLSLAARADEAKKPDAPKAEAPAAADVKPDADAKVVELLNGKDLTGWGYKKDGKVTPFDGKTEADDKRYTAKDGMIVVNPGKGIAQLWTVAEFPKDFELRL